MAAEVDVVVVIGVVDATSAAGTVGVAPDRVANCRVASLATNPGPPGCSSKRCPLASRMSVMPLLLVSRC